MAELLEKLPASWRVTPNLRDYAAECARFSWQQALGALDGLPGGRGLNIAHEAVDRHAGGAAGQRVALRWLPRRGPPRQIRYAELREQTNRFANALAALGVAARERVFVLLPRIPPLYVAALGAEAGLRGVRPVVTTTLSADHRVSDDLRGARLLGAIVLEALRLVAPEADLAIAIHERTGVEIPEADYAQLRSLADGVAYLRRRLGPAPP